METTRIEWETRTSTSTIRQNVKCKCGERRSRLLTQTVKRTYRSDMCGAVGRPQVARVLADGRREQAEQCACGRELHFRDVKGSHRPDKPCNAKCVGSIGHVCECSCGGKNHGAGFGA
jgi:hypothetical protein